MGFALAEECANRGAEVILIAGPVNLHCYHPNIKRINILSASEMHEQSISYFSQMDVAILCAAVADYTPLEQTKQKIKRNDDKLVLNLKATKDIAADMGKIKQAHQRLVGFALETNNATQHAIKKLHKKNLDFIVLNSLENKGAGFQTDTNQITIIDVNDNVTHYPLKSKPEVASDIVDHLEMVL